MTVENRFWKKVNKTESCWLWTGALNNGYGWFRFNGESVYAHKFLWELLKIKVPEGLELDHLCRNRSCVNLAHLEAVTHKVNMARGFPGRTSATECINGHKYTEENTYRYKHSITGTMRRGCIRCRQLASRRGYEKKLKGAV